MKTQEIITKQNKKSKKCICPEIDKQIRKEAAMFSSRDWKIRTQDGFYHWG